MAGILTKSKLFITALTFAVSMFSFGPASAGAATGVASAATTTECPLISETTAFGIVSQTVVVGTDATYRIWSRLKPSSATDNSYYLQIDDGCAANVGDSDQLAVGEWTWVNYQNGNSAEYIDVALTAGTHTFNYIGKEASVQLDRVLFLTDTACLPEGMGDNCAVVDVSPPMITISSPADGSRIQGTINIESSIYDLSQINKAELYIDNVLHTTVGPSETYVFPLDTTTLANGNHTLKIRATDDAYPANTAEKSVTVNVQNMPAVGQLDVQSSLTVDKTTIVTGNTLQATATYKNATEFPVTVNNILLSALTPGATAGTPGFFTTPTTGPYTVEPGASLIITGTRAMSASEPLGTYRAYVEYQDIAGQMHTDTTQASFTVTAPDTTAPAVVLTAPAGGANVVQGSGLTMTASSTDNTGVAKVEMYVDNVLTKTITVAPYSFSWNSTNARIGTHTMYAKSYDAAGNSSVTPSKSFTVSLKPGTGLSATYYKDAAFGTSGLTRIDPTVNFNWDRNAPASAIPSDKFSSRWTGSVVATASGTYTIYATGDDGIRVWVNGKQIISYWGSSSIGTRTATISLTAQTYNLVKVEHYDNRSAASVKLEWSGPGISRQVVPQSRLYPLSQSEYNTAVTQLTGNSTTASPTFWKPTGQTF